MSKEMDFDASSELKELILLASGMGLENLQEQRSLLPMLITVKDSEYALVVIAEDGGDTLGMAARHVAELPDETSSYALIFDGRLTIDDDSFQAVIVQAAERGSGHGHMVFQRYEPALRCMRRLGILSTAGKLSSSCPVKHNKALQLTAR